MEPEDGHSQKWHLYLLLSAGILIFLIGLALLLYAAYDIYALCAGEPSYNCSNVFTEPYVQEFLGLGIPFTIAGIIAIIVFRIKSRTKLE